MPVCSDVPETIFVTAQAASNCTEELKGSTKSMSIGKCKLQCRANQENVTTLQTLPCSDQNPVQFAGGTFSKIG